MQVVTSAWYQDYVADENMPRSMLFKVLSAANYMTIRPLLDLACLWCTFQLQGKSPEEVRQNLRLILARDGVAFPLFLRACILCSCS